MKAFKVAPDEEGGKALSWMFDELSLLFKSYYGLQSPPGFKRKRVGKLLRTVPTIVIAHTLCESRDTRVSYQ